MTNENCINKRNLYSIGMIFFMLLIAELSHEKEIIFPEIAALVIGAWSVNVQPWNVSREKMFLLMTLSAFFGIAIVRYTTLPVYSQVLIAFTFTGISLLVSHTSLVPMISACILPILLRTTSFIYPLSVSVMTAIIGLFQFYLESHNKKTHRQYDNSRPEWKSESITWLLRLLLLAIISCMPIATHNYYFIAPPVIVTFVEFSFTASKARKHPAKILFLVSIASIIGFLTKVILSNLTGLPVCITGCIALLLLLIAFQKLQIYFPPAGAIALLPYILNQYHLWLYPIHVTIGTAVFIGCALFFFRPLTENSPITE